MKRTFAVVLFLAGLGLLLKLAMKDTSNTRFTASSVPEAEAASTGSSLDAQIQGVLAKYTVSADREFVAGVLKRYAHNGLRIEQSDGLRGLKLLDVLDLEAIFLYETHPEEFRKLREGLDSDRSAAQILLHWREYFGYKRADETDRAILIAEISRLGFASRRIAAKYPSALPLILTDPVGVEELIDRWSGTDDELEDALACLGFISLERGSADLRKALRTLDHHGPLALEAFRAMGLEGFALVTLHGPLLEALGTSPPLDQSLLLVRVNVDEINRLSRTLSVETLASHIRHVAAVNLMDQVSGSSGGLRLVVEYGQRGEQAIRRGGADAADVVYELFKDRESRSMAVEALAEHGPMALAMLGKYAQDPDFLEILRKYGPAVIPPIARTDATPEALAALRAKTDPSFSETLARSVLAFSRETGQGTIRAIKQDGLERVSTLASKDVAFQQFLPLYDLIHLGAVVGRGYTPTHGELTWALIDGAFVVVDALSLTAAQPQAVAAAEVARGEIKAVVRGAIQAAGREAVEEGGLSATQSGVRQGVKEMTEHAAKWWTVRVAGGTSRVLRRLPEALSKLGVTEIAKLGRPLCERAGLALSSWKPVRFLVKGAEVLVRIPPEKGLKYVGVQLAQAGVGAVGIIKMEEHLASRKNHGVERP